jgi:uncharacterized membrane protein YvbJ
MDCHQCKNPVNEKDVICEWCGYQIQPTQEQSTRTTNSEGSKSLPNTTVILSLGIISIATFWLYGILGLIFGIIALVLFKKDKAIYMSNPHAYGASFKNAKAGKVCAIIGVTLSGLMLLYFIFLMIFLMITLMNL